MVVLNHKIAVNLEEFVLRGKFDFLELGMSSDDVLATIPEPETSSDEPIHRALIWRYGQFELHFDPDSGKLVRIFCDYVPTLDGGEVFEISPWILRERLDLPQFLAVLNAAGIDYAVRHNAIIEASIVQVTESAVQLAFSVEHEGPDAGKKVFSALWKGD